MHNRLIQIIVIILVCFVFSVGIVLAFSGNGPWGSSDHGSLFGLSDDDHTQYLLINGTRAMSGSVDLGGNYVTLDSTPDSDDTGNGYRASMVIDSGATITVGDCLHMDSDSEFVDSNASGSATMPCQAMALEAGTGSKYVLLKGFMRNDDWNWTPGSVLYTSTTAGELTDAAPSGSGEVIQIVGWSVTADIIRFDPDLDTEDVP